MYSGLTMINKINHPAGTHSHPGQSDALHPLVAQVSSFASDSHVHILGDGVSENVGTLTGIYLYFHPILSTHSNLVFSNSAAEFPPWTVFP